MRTAMSGRRRFSANCFMPNFRVAAIPRIKSFILRSGVNIWMHHFCGSAIAAFFVSPALPESDPSVFFHILAASVSSPAVARAVTESVPPNSLFLQTADN
jgi:hypothetical protein